MRRTIVKLISQFIQDKNKRKRFREKHDPIQKLFHEVYHLKESLLYSKEQIKDLEEVYCIPLQSFTAGMRYGHIKSYDEHLENEAALLKNLDEDALKNIQKILDRIKKQELYKVFLPDLYFDKEELIEYFEVLEMPQKVKNLGDYYQYENYKLPVNHFESSVFKNKLGLYTLKTLNNISKDSVIIDAGANVLDTALIFREFFPENQIITFEPVKSVFELGHKTRTLNNLDNVIEINAGLSDKEEILDIFVGGEYSYGSSYLYHDNCKPEKCKNIRLDDFVKEHNLKVGLIKTDVEGYEPKLLEGAINTIREQRPVLMISIYHNYDDFYKIKPWIENLNLGYKFNFFNKPIKSGSLAGETLLIGEVY